MHINKIELRHQNDTVRDFFKVSNIFKKKSSGFSSVNCNAQRFPNNNLKIHTAQSLFLPPVNEQEIEMYY